MFINARYRKMGSAPLTLDAHGTPQVFDEGGADGCACVRVIYLTRMRPRIQSGKGMGVAVLSLFMKKYESGQARLRKLHHADRQQEGGGGWWRIEA